MKVAFFLIALWGSTLLAGDIKGILGGPVGLSVQELRTNVVENLSQASGAVIQDTQNKVEHQLSWAQRYPQYAVALFWAIPVGATVVINVLGCFFGKSSSENQ